MEERSDGIARADCGKGKVTPNGGSGDNTARRGNARQVQA
jgi:hypothetical protein